MDLEMLVQLAEKLVLRKHYNEVRILAHAIYNTGKIPTEYAHLVKDKSLVQVNDNEV